MPITSIYDAESLIVAKLEDMVSSDMMFTEADSAGINNSTFDGKDSDDERVGILVLNSGFRTNAMFGANKKQELKQLWQVVVVCPRELYHSHGGKKVIDIMVRLKGWRVSAEIGIMQLIDDERGFNRPDYAQDVVYLPMVFKLKTSISWWVIWAVKRMQHK